MATFAPEPVIANHGTAAAARLVEGIVAEIQAHERFLVVSHARPDGDAVGSVLAMGSVLKQLGKQVDMVLADAVPQVYRTLPSVEEIRESRSINQSDYDLAIILECDGTPRTGITGIDGMHVINIDHHVTGTGFGALNWIDPDASAVAAMVYEIALAAGADVTPAIATCLYTALLTDTGSFTYPGTSAETFTLAHQLILIEQRIPDCIFHELQSRNETVYAERNEVVDSLLGRGAVPLRTELIYPPEISFLRWNRPVRLEEHVLVQMRQAGKLRTFCVRAVLYT